MIFLEKVLSCSHFVLSSYVCLVVVVVVLQKLILFLFTNRMQFPVKVFARKKYQLHFTNFW